MDLNLVRDMVITELLRDLPFVAKQDTEFSKHKEGIERYLKNYQRKYTQPSDQSKVFDLAELLLDTSTNIREKDLMALGPLTKKTTAQETNITSDPQTSTPRDIQNTSISTNERKKGIMILGPLTPKDIQNTSTSTKKRKQDVMSLVGPLTKKTRAQKTRITSDPQTSTYPSEDHLSTNKRYTEKLSKLLKALHPVVAQPMPGFNKLIAGMAAFLNDQSSEVMDLDEDPSPKGIKPSSETRGLPTSEQVNIRVPRTIEKADPVLSRPQRISINLSSKEKETVPLEKYIFENFKMMYELRQTDFCFPDHSRPYPRINLLPGADPVLLKSVYEMGFLGTVYPSFDLKELGLIPELLSDTKKFDKRRVFLKFFQISPEYYPGLGVFETYSFIEVGYVAENFSFDYETNQPWRKTPRVDREFVRRRRALGFKSISSIMKSYLKTHHVLKMRRDYSIVGKIEGIRESSTRALEELASKMVHHEFIASPETAQKLCRMLNHEDCTRVLAQLQNVIDESISSPGDEHDPFGIHNAIQPSKQAP